MSEPVLHHSEHRLVVQAPARVLYDLVARADNWPVVFGPTVHTDYLERSAHEERFQLWALVNGQVATWRSRRSLNPQRQQISFEQEVSQPPVASMAGEWRFRPRPGGSTEVVLRHRYTAVDEEPATLDWIAQALERNSTAELGALGAVAGLGAPLADVLLSFTDRVELPGPAEAVHRFVHEADRWAERLPHVEAVRLTELGDGIQELAMDTLTPDGGTHSTRSVRVCRPAQWIAFKQLSFPDLLLGHSGLWTFRQNEDGGTSATIRHVALLNPDAVATTLGEGATLADARELVHRNLSANSRTTIGHAGEYARGLAAEAASVV
jgi:aromatase